jgi:putative ABC transport system substrate-binding protein
LPVAARAQQPEPTWRIGVLMGYRENDPEADALLFGLTRGLSELGWTDGRNLRVDVRWASGDVDRARMLAKELVDLGPSVIVTNGTPATSAVKRETQTIPIVFVTLAGDPVRSGFVASFARPGGNITGFILSEGSMGGKWLQLLTEIAPGVKRVAIMFNPDTAPYVTSYFLAPFEAAARSLKVEPMAAPVHSDAEIEKAITLLGREPRGGLIVPPDNFLFVHREPIISLAARNAVPVIYPQLVQVRERGLLSYGPDQADIFRRSASYVDRILRGAKPADLPVQLPIKFEMSVNLKTAMALGLTVPQSILLLADEVIQ